MEISREVPQKLKTELLYDPAIPLLCIYSKGCKSAYHRDAATLRSVVALLTTAKLWNQPGCSSPAEQRIHTQTRRGISSAIKKNEIRFFGTGYPHVKCSKTDLRKTSITCSLSYAESTPRIK
jgi:hypothetical protein